MKKTYTVILQIGDNLFSDENLAFYFYEEHKAKTLSNLLFNQGYDVSYIVSYKDEVKTIFGDDES